MINNCQGAWMTDIDDTLIPSGIMPDDFDISRLADFIRVLKKHDILWVPMSGVAMVKLGPRILFRLPEDLLTHVLYYGGDGSLKYSFDSESGQWKENLRFSSLLSDSQTYMILGEKEMRSSLKQLHAISGDDDDCTEERITEAKKVLLSKGYKPSECILDLLKKELELEGINPDLSETYFRGGSVSWMMLGDISSEPYGEEKNLLLRKRLIDRSKAWLAENNHLEDLGPNGVSVPFPGARGIKFVLMGNDKEKSARDLMKKSGLAPEQFIFAGNELFQGGNDNMIRNIPGVTLLSVGDREDTGPDLIVGRVKTDRGLLEDVEANNWWIDWTVRQLNSGTSWASVLQNMKEEGS
jgi:hypothetical protein